MRVVHLIGMGCLIGMVLNLALSSQAQATCSRIAFTASRENDEYAHIYTVKPDGPDLTQLTHEERDDYAPTWSPDGRQIAFIRARQKTDPNVLQPEYTLYVMDADGAHAHEIPVTSFKLSVFFGSRVSWSPDGQSLVYQAGEDSYSAEREVIFVTALDPAPGDLPRIVVDGSQAFSPTFLPDGSIGFVLFDVNGLQNMNIYRMDVAGRVRTRVSNYDYLEFAQSPVWSPDGEHIAYSYATTYRQMWDADPGDNALWVMDKDGSHARQLADNELEDIDPTWSPDGQQIAFNTHIIGLSHISIIDADGANQHFLFDGEAWNFQEMQPAWSPFLLCDAAQK